MLVQKNHNTLFKGVKVFKPTLLACCLACVSSQFSFAAMEALEFGELSEAAGYCNYNCVHLSLDGSIAALTGRSTDGKSGQVIIFSGKDYKTITRLPLKNASALAISGDGKIISANDNEDYLLFGEHWEKQIKLTNLNLPASIFTLSYDGSIAVAGDTVLMREGDNWNILEKIASYSNHTYATSRISGNGNVIIKYIDDTNYSDEILVRSSSKKPQYQPVKILNVGLLYNVSHNGDFLVGITDNGKAAVWSGDKWQNVTTLNINNNFTVPTAISADGKVIAGFIYDVEAKDIDDKLPYTPVLWRWDGKKWNMEQADTRKNLWIQALSADGKVAVAQWLPSSNDNWRMVILREKFALDKENSIQSLYIMANDSFRLLSLQNGALKRLLNGCHNFNGFCYRIVNDFRGEGHYKDQTIGLRLGYGFNNGFSMGVSLDRLVAQHFLPDSYQRSRHNLGFGIFSRYEKQLANSTFYLEPALAWNNYRVKTQRVQLNNTEAGQGTSKIKGFAYKLTVGQDFQFENKQLGWYASLRHSEVKRAGYTEHNVKFPVTYGAMQQKEHALALGGQANFALTPKLSWLVGAEVEQRLQGKPMVYRANADFIGKVQHRMDNHKTRWLVQTGLRYQFSPAFNVEFIPYTGRNDAGKTYWGTQLNFSGKF